MRLWNGLGWGAQAVSKHEPVEEATQTNGFHKVEGGRSVFTIYTLRIIVFVNNRKRLNKLCFFLLFEGGILNYIMFVFWWNKPLKWTSYFYSLAIKSTILKNLFCSAISFLFYKCFFTLSHLCGAAKDLHENSMKCEWNIWADFDLLKAPQRCCTAGVFTSDCHVWSISVQTVSADLVGWRVVVGGVVTESTLAASVVSVHVRKWSTRLFKRQSVCGLQDTHVTFHIHI